MKGLLRCLKCGSEYPLGWQFEGCSKCASATFRSGLEVVSEDEPETGRAGSISDPKDTGIWRYSRFIPLDVHQKVTLSEGNTPLIPARRLGAELALDGIYLKDESRNPTWSFKDRVNAASVTMAVELGAKTVTASSSGNHGASAAAYAASAGLRSVIFTHNWSQYSFVNLIRQYGATLVPVKTAQERTVLMKRCVEEFGWCPMTSYASPMPANNPYGIEGGKTIAFEVVEQLGHAPDVVVWPLGVGDGYYAIWKGMKQLRDAGHIDKLPRMVSVEVATGGPLANAVEKRLDHIEPVRSTGNTAAVSIAGSTTSFASLKALRESKGEAVLVTDDEILAAQRSLAKLEGIYPEFSSAATVAGLQKIKEGIDPAEEVVCMLTSTGLKDSPTPLELEPIDSDWASFQRYLERSTSLLRSGGR